MEGGEKIEGKKPKKLDSINFSGSVKCLFIWYSQHTDIKPLLTWYVFCIRVKTIRYNSIDKKTYLVLLEI